jgi:hypothetical protein
MIKLAELPRLKNALTILGLDNGADVARHAIIPASWEVQARLAEDELLRLTPVQVTALAMGEETERNAVVKLAPNADAVLCAAFDGPLADPVFRDWKSIFDARRAEQRSKA